MACNIKYRGEVYNEQDAKSIISYHYLVEDKVLDYGRESIQKVKNRLESLDNTFNKAHESIQKVNKDLGLGSEIVTIEESTGLINIDVNPIASSIIQSDEITQDWDQETESTETVRRKNYNLQGLDQETLEDMESKVSMMEERFSDLGVTTHFIMDGDLSDSGQLLGTSDQRYTEMVESGEINEGDAVIVVNPNNLYSDTVFHEYGHLFIDLLGGMKNTRIRYAYSKIKNSPLAEEVKANYPELSGESLQKEIMATAIGKEATDIFESGNENIGFIQKFLNWVRDGIKSLLSIPTDSVKTLANELLGDTEVELTGNISSESQQFKAYKKDQTREQRIVQGAEKSLKDIKSKVNIVLKAIGNSTQEDKIKFKNEVKSLSDSIEQLGIKSNLIAINKFMDRADEMGSVLEKELEEILNKANEGEKVNIPFHLLSEIDLYKSLFSIVDDIQSHVTSGYFKKEFVKEGWDEEANQAFKKTIDNAKSQFDRIHDLHLKTGRHHLADRLAKYSNRSIVTRRVELEKEFKGIYKIRDGESMTNYNQRIREHVNEKITEELPQLKERERELIYNRLNSSPADIGSFAMWVSSEKDLNSMAIQLASKLLDEADLRRDFQMQDKKLEAWEIFQQFDKETSGTDAKTKYKDLYQEGSDGNLYYTTEYNVEWYIQFKDLTQKTYEAEEKFGEGSPEHLAAKTKKDEWVNKNTKRVEEGTNAYNRPTEKWRNKEYDKVMSKPESGKAKMLQYLLKNSHDNSTLLHGNRSLVYNAPGSDTSFIRVPSIGKSTFERVTSGNILNNIKDSLERAVMVKTDDEDLIGDTDNLQAERDGLKVLTNAKGEIRYGVPIHFRGKMALKDISYDLMSSSLMDSYMSMNYHYKSGLQIELELLKDVVSEKEVTQTAGFAKRVILNGLDKLGATEVVRKASEKSNELTVLKSMVENRLYGIKNANIEYAKVASSLMSWSASTMLMFNLPAAVVNALQGKVFNFIEASAKEHFTGKDLKAAEQAFFKDTKDWVNDIGKAVPTSKTNMLLELFNVQGEFKALSNKLIENNRFKALARKHTGFALNHMGEMYMHGTLMYAILNNIKILNSKNQFIDKDGKVVKTKDKAMTLGEALFVGKDGKLDINKNVYKTSFGNSTFSLHHKDKGLLEVKALINKIAHDIHGNYNEDIQNMAQRYIVGKFAFMLRKWIVPGFNKRWRGAVHFTKPTDQLQDQVENFYSEDLQSFQEGYYTTAARFAWNTIKDIKQTGLQAASVNWTMLSDRELANMRRFLSEATIIFLTWAVSAILKGMAEDLTDPTKREALFHLTYYTRRMFSELHFYTNPLEAYKIMSTPAASLAYIAKLGNFANQVTTDVMRLGYGEGLEEYVHGKRKGELKLWKRTSDIVPIMNQWNRDIEESTGWLFNLY